MGLKLMDKASMEQIVHINVVKDLLFSHVKVLATLGKAIHNKKQNEVLLDIITVLLQDHALEVLENRLTS